jgi:hypothetical protein
MFLNILSHSPLCMHIGFLSLRFLVLDHFIFQKDQKSGRDSWKGNMVWKEQCYSKRPEFGYFLNYKLLDKL